MLFVTYFGFSFSSASISLHFASEIFDFVSKLLDFASDIMGFASNILDFASKILLPDWYQTGQLAGIRLVSDWPADLCR